MVLSNKKEAGVGDNLITRSTDMKNQLNYRIVSLAIIILLAFSLRTFAQEAKQYPVIGEVVRIDNRINELISSDARIELLASGFEWSEGPLWIQDAGGSLIFSDIPRNSVMKWKEGEGISLFMKPSGYTGVADYGREPGSNGLTLDLQGRIIFCEHGDRRIS